MDLQTDIQIVRKIDTANAYNFLSHPESGALCVFVGSVRSMTQGEKVNALKFEVYDKMALQEMKNIAEVAIKKWSLNKVVLHHVSGSKRVQEPVVLVGVSCAHRGSSFEASKYLIDTLKATVPIWKKEVFENKEVWVSQHP